MRNPISRSRPTLWPALAVMLVVSTFALSSASYLSWIGGGHEVRTPVTPGLSSWEAGQAQAGAAGASLARGEGPATHPSVAPVSPGGYNWNNVTSSIGSAPSGRLTSLAWDASDGYVLLYGWASASGNPTDTWTYLNGTWTNITTSVSGSPGQVFTPLLAFDPSTQKVVLYVGAAQNITWTYHNKVWSNITATAGPHPPAASLPALVTDTTDGELVLVGGTTVYGASRYIHDTWIFKNGVWSNQSLTAPFSFGRINLPIGTDDPVDHGALVVAESQWRTTVPARSYTSTFLFTGGSWTNLTPSAGTEPPFPLIGGVGYLPSISTVILVEPAHGNVTGAQIPNSVTWEFSHRVWSNITAVTNPGPEPAILIGSAVNPLDSTMVVFGGLRSFNPTVYPNTWIFSAPPTLTASVSRSTIDANQSVHFTGTVSGGASPVTTHWTLGDGSNASGLSATHSFTATGVITATLWATDLVGHTVSATVSLWVNPALTVTLNGTPSNPPAGSWIALGSQLKGGTSPFTYAWTLGDGSTSTAPSLGHRFSAAATYRVNLTVTDAAGASASASLTVAVGAAPATNSVSLSSGTGLYLLIGLIVLALLAVVLAVLLMRKPRSPPGPPSPYVGLPPPGAGGPPTGATGPPTPPPSG